MAHEIAHINRKLTIRSKRKLELDAPAADVNIASLAESLFLSKKSTLARTKRL